MKLAETVTFGGSGLDRAAHLRGDEAALTTALRGGADVVLPLWRGKPLMSGAAGTGTLTWLRGDHPVLAEAADLRVFLGLDDGQMRFAADISAWVPTEVDEAQIGGFLDASLQVHPAAPEGAVFQELRASMTWLSAREAELAATAKALLDWHRTHRFCSRCGAESVVAEGGWQRACAACGARHFPRTDPVVIMLVTHGNDVLVGRSPGWPEAMYSLLAGFVEPGETLEAAVRREVFEETRVQVGAVSYLASQPWPYPASLMFGCQAAATSREITVDPVEIEDALWLSREEMTDVFAGRHDRMRPPRKGAIAHFLLENWLADRLD
ncbi:NAD(+) diphosphatase [Rhodophyticola sp. CCM32]|uniref:NAD(+) diphosphatase n=1 Tax=Rhodophyticola sp. CCM32 TaxID=2916397 RepID=UPI00107F37E6|nr:NAD(+) diphosphatase [Rhodophyticola sp. CCM32]QBY02276.1 NAD(+) diphosphatase [Rhodophyticola sp. CCM32]